MPLSEPQGVLACDLDGTIVSVNTFPRFVKFLLAYLVGRRDYASAGRLILTLAFRKVARRDHIRLKEFVHRLGGDVEKHDLDEWARRVVARWGCADVMGLVDKWPGPRYLVTAAPECYALSLGSRLGFDVVQGSTWESARYVENVGASKVERLRSLGIARVALAVTDDPLLDAPLLAIAARPLVVTGGCVREA